MYRSIHIGRQDTRHVYRFDQEAGGTIRFYKDDMPIEATVDDAGYLIMQARQKEVAFVYVFDDEMFRTCPQCYGKVPIHYHACTQCEWVYS